MGIHFSQVIWQSLRVVLKTKADWDIFPSATLIGYQLEKQYIGTENFSALGEVLLMVSGLEKGHALPSLTLMNGFRFGKAGWEIAFGPGFGLKKVFRWFL